MDHSLKQVINLESLSMALIAALLVGGCSSTRSGLTTFSAENPFNAVPSLSVKDFAATQKLAGYSLIFSGNVNGELNTCGCAVNPKGGVDRRYNALKEMQAKLAFSPLLLDAGNAFFASKKLDPALEQSQKENAALIMKAHKMLGVAAQNVGALDLSAGIMFLKNQAAVHSLNLISSNLVDDKSQPIFKKFERLKLSNGLELAIYGLIAPQDLGLSGVHIKDPIATLKEELSRLSQDIPVLVLSDLGLSLDRQLAEEMDRAMVIVGAHEMSSLEVPVHIGKSILVQAQIQGQQWGLLEVASRPNTQSFYNPTLGNRFSKRWSESAEEERKAKRLSSNDDREFELDKLAAVAEDMKRYAPGDLGKASVYDYSLVDLTEEYRGHNVMSQLMRKPAVKSKSH